MARRPRPRTGESFAGDLARRRSPSARIRRRRSSTPPRPEDVDVVVVGNVGMSGRKEFLLGNVPNRVSHNAHRTVMIVNTRQRIEEQAQKKRWFFR